MRVGGRGGREKRTSIVFMTSFYCLKAYKGEGLSENQQIWAAYFIDGSFQKFIYGHVAMPSIEIQIWSLWYFLYNILHKIQYISCKFYPVRLFNDIWNYNLDMFLYKRNISFTLGNLILFYYWAIF